MAGKRFVLMAVCALMLATAPAARAQESLSAASPTARWSGEVLFGWNVGANIVSQQDHDIRLVDSGELTVTLTPTAPTALELTVELLIPNPDDPFAAEIIESSTGPQPTITVSGLAPGNYVVRAAGALNGPTTYDAEATLKPGPATRPAPGAPKPAATPAPSSTPPPAAATPEPTPEPIEDLEKPPAPATAKLARMPRRAAQLKVLRGTAADPDGIARVDVALVRRDGRRCRQMAANFVFTRLASCGAPSSYVIAAGTSAWSLRLRRRLTPGTYTAFVRVIDPAVSITTVKRTFTLR